MSNEGPVTKAPAKADVITKNPFAARLGEINKNATTLSQAQQAEPPQQQVQRVVDNLAVTTASPGTMAAVREIAYIFTALRGSEQQAQREESKEAVRFSQAVMAERFDRIAIAKEWLAVFEGLERGQSEQWLREQEKAKKVKEEERLREASAVQAAIKEGLRAKEGVRERVAGRAAVIEAGARKTGLDEEDALALESLRKKWEELLKEEERLRKEKDPKARERIAEELERRFRALAEETRKRVEDVYKRLYGAKIELLKDAISKAEELLKAGKSKGEIEAAILKALEKDPALRDAFKNGLPSVKTSHGIVLLLRSLLVALLGEPLCKRLEQLIGILKEPKGRERRAETAAAVVRLLTTIAMLGRLRVLLRKLERALKEGASDAEIAAILREIDAAIPLNELGEELDELLKLSGEEFRRRADAIRRSLNEEVWVASTMRDELARGDPAKITRTAEMIRKIYEELLPRMRDETSAAVEAGRAANPVALRKKLCGMIDERIKSFKEKELGKL